jgi:hypothetical protein
MAWKWAAAGISPFDAELFVSSGADLAAVREMASRGVRAVSWVGSQQSGPRGDGQVAHLEVANGLAELWWSEVCVNVRKDAGEIMVQLGDIAEMCGVSLSAVSSWRKTDPAFPSPIVASRSPRFTLSSLLDVGSGPLRHANLSPSLLARMIVRTLSERVAVGDQRSGAVSWNQLRRQVADLLWECGRAEADASLRTEITRIISATGSDSPDEVLDQLMPAEDDRLWRMLRTAALGWMAGIASPQAVAAGEVLDLLLMMIDEVAPAEEAATGPALAGVMIGLAGITPGDVVLDPACGIGELLVAASVRATRGAAGGTYIGCDIDSDAVRVAEVRLGLRYLDPRIFQANWLEETAADTLGIPSADTILIDPPLDQPVGEWVRRSLPVLSDRGRLVIVARESDLGPDTPIGELASEGHVEAEIKLPQRARGEGRIAKYVVVAAKESFRGQLPVRDDLSHQRITISGGRVRIGPGGGVASDRLGLDYSAAQRALIERRQKAARGTSPGAHLGGQNDAIGAPKPSHSIDTASAVELAEQLIERLAMRQGDVREHETHLVESLLRFVQLGRDAAGP